MTSTDAVLPGVPAADAGAVRAARAVTLPRLLPGLLCAAYALGSVLGWGSAGVAVFMGDFGLAGASLAASLSCVVRACRIRGSARPAWLLFGFSSLMSAVGNGMWGWYELVLRTPVPSPSAADYVFLFFAPPVIVGLLILAKRPRGSAAWICLVLDGWLIAGSLFTVSWSMALARTARGDEGNLLQTSVLLAYPVFDILLITMVLGLRFRSKDCNRRGVHTAAVALAVTVVCDALWTSPAVRSGYHSGELLDAGWFTGSVLLACAPWASGRFRSSRGSLRAHPSTAGQHRRATSWFSALTPYVAAAVCTAALLHNALSSRSMDRVVLVTACTVVLALIVRQGIMLLENISLAQALAHKEAHFRSLVQGSSDVIMIAGRDGVLSYVSPAALGVYGRDPAELRGGRLRDLVHPDDIGRVLEEAERFLTSGTGTESSARVECRVRSGTGEWLHVESAVNRHRDGLIFNCRDVTERVRLQAQLRHNAFHDPLTDLPNRAFFTDRVQAALSGSAEESRVVAVLFLDLDGFKAVNDTAGHQVGDDLLVRAARRLQETVRSGDTVARLGGDEFAALVTGRLEESHVRDIAERLRTALSEPYVLDGVELAVAASIGIAFAESGADPAGLMRNADLAMYRAKSSGKGRVAVYSPQLRADLDNRTHVAQRFHGAVREGRLTLLHQPVVDLVSGEILAVEAQAWWRSAQGTLLSPSDVMVGESGDRISRYARWLVQQSVAEAAARWRHDRERGGPGVPVTVRLSASRLVAPGTFESIDRALRESGLPPNRLILAVDSGGPGGSPESLDELARRLVALRRLGVRVALEGFGTGPASLVWLRQLPVDILKLDRALVQGLVESAFTRTLADHVLRLGHDLGLLTGAEGVDDHRQAAVLRELGCNRAQGLLYAGPLDGRGLRRALLRRGFSVPRPTAPGPPRTPTTSDGRAGDTRAAALAAPGLAATTRTPTTRTPTHAATTRAATTRAAAMTRAATSPEPTSPAPTSPALTSAERVLYHCQASDLPERPSDPGPHDETPVPPA